MTIEIKNTDQYLFFREWTKDDTTALALLAVWLANNYPDTYLETPNQRIPCHLFSVFLGESTKTKKSTILNLVKGKTQLILGTAEFMSDRDNNSIGYIEVDEIQRTLFPKISQQGAGLSAWLCKMWDSGISMRSGVRQRTSNGGIKKPEKTTNKEDEEQTEEIKRNYISLACGGIKTMFFNTMPDVLYDSGLLWRFFFVDIENKIKILDTVDYYFSNKVKIDCPLIQDNSWVGWDVDFILPPKDLIQKYIEQIPQGTAHGERSVNMMLRIARLFSLLKKHTMDEECLSCATEVIISSIEYLASSLKQQNPHEEVIINYLREKGDTAHMTLYNYFTRSGSRTKEQWNAVIYSLLGKDKYGRDDFANVPRIEKIRSGNKTIYSLIDEESDPLDTIKSFCNETKNPDFINQSQAISIKKLTYEDGEVRKYPNGKWKDTELKTVEEVETNIKKTPVLLGVNDGKPLKKEVEQTYIGIKFDFDKYFYIDIDGDNHLQNGITKIREFLTLEQIKNTYCEISKSGKGYHLVFLKPEGVELYSRNQGGVEVKTNHLMNRKIGAFHNGVKPSLPPQSIIDFCSNKEKTEAEILSEAKGYKEQFLDGITNTIRLKNSSATLHFIQNNGRVEYLNVEYYGSRHIAGLSIASFLACKGLQGWEEDLKAWFLSVKPGAELEFKNILKDARNYAGIG